VFFVKNFFAGSIKLVVSAAGVVAAVVGSLNDRGVKMLAVIENNSAAAADQVARALAVPSDAEINRGDLWRLPAPAAVNRYVPVPHATVARVVSDQLAGVALIKSERWTVSNYGRRLFGVIDLALNIGSGLPGGGVSVALGVRSSYDKRLSLGIVAGSRVCVCSNLAFSGEISYKRKHTLNGLSDFSSQVVNAISKIQAYREVEAARFQRWANHSLTADQVGAFVLELFGRDLLPQRLFSEVYAELSDSRYDDFAGNFNAWTLFNRLTTVLNQRAITRAADHAIETQGVIKSIESKFFASVN
jgi:hypothetical protein